MLFLTYILALDAKSMLDSFVLFIFVLSSVWKLKIGQNRQWLSMIHLRPIPSRMQRTLLCIPETYLKGCAFPESSPLKINTDLSVKHPCGHSVCRVYFPRAHATFQWSFKVVRSTLTTFFVSGELAARILESYLSRRTCQDSLFRNNRRQICSIHPCTCRCFCRGC